MRERFVPLSVRNGSRWMKFRWRVKGWREWLALKLAPWLEPFAVIDAEQFERAQRNPTIRAFAKYADEYVTAVRKREDAP